MEGTIDSTPKRRRPYAEGNGRLESVTPTHSLTASPHWHKNGEASARFRFTYDDPSMASETFGAMVTDASGGSSEVSAGCVGTTTLQIPDWCGCSTEY